MSKRHNKHIGIVYIRMRRLFSLGGVMRGQDKADRYLRVVSNGKRGMVAMLMCCCFLYCILYCCHIVPRPGSVSGITENLAFCAGPIKVIYVLQLLFFVFRLKVCLHFHALISYALVCRLVKTYIVCNTPFCKRDHKHVHGRIFIR